MACEIPQVRFVRCPKCHRLLTESPDVPLYKCGGCGTVLQAKAWRSNKGHGASQMPSDLHENKSEASNDVPTLNRLTGSLPTGATSRATDHGGDRTAGLCEDPPYSNPENNPHCSQVEEPSQCKENGNGKVGSTPNSDSTGHAAAPMGEEAISVVASAQQSRVLQASEHSSSNGADQHGSVNSSPSCKMGESAESGFSEEEMLDGYSGNGRSGTLGTPTASRSAHPSDGSISSCDAISGKSERYRLLSRRTFRNRQLSESNSAKERGVEEEGETLVGTAASPDEAGSKQRSSSGCDAETLHQDVSQDFEKLCSEQNGLESSLLSRSLSTGSTNSGGVPPDDRKLLATVEALRHHLSRTGDRRFPIITGGGGHEGRWPLFPNHESQQVLPSFCNANMPPRRPRAYVRTPMAHHRLHPSGMPSPAQCSSSSCSYHHHEGYNAHAQLPSPAYCTACISHTCYRPFSSPSSGCGSSSDNASERDLLKPPRRERGRQQYSKRHCRPASGGAPFVVCDGCLEVLQLPVDFRLSASARRPRLRCGACSQVLTFWYHGGHLVPDISAQWDAPHNTMHHVSKHELSVDSVNPSRGSLQEDPCSYSEEYDPTLNNTYSTDDEPVQPWSLRRPLEGKGKGHHGEEAMGSALHRLLGYPSARHLIYEPGEEEDYEGCDSEGVSRFYRGHGDAYFRGGDGRGLA